MALNICKTRMLSCLKTSTDTGICVRKSVFQPEILNTTDCKTKGAALLHGAENTEGSFLVRNKAHVQLVMGLWLESLRNGLSPLSSHFLKLA